MDALTAISTRRTPQTEQADTRQVPNAAGYYTGERELTKANADVVLASASTAGEWLIEQVVAISTAGRAPKQNPAIFALAAVAGLGDEPARKAAFAALPAVCRTGTHLFLFTRYMEQFRGWGRGARRAIGSWFLDKPVDQVAYQAVKYRQRDGWSMRDLLRLAHPDTDDPTRKALFDWTCGRGEPAVSWDGATLPDIVRAFQRAQATTQVAEWVELIGMFPLSWEMLPDAALTEPKVWHALITKGMPQTALIRQLPRLTRLGVLTGTTLSTVLMQLTDPDRLRKARIHPINLLVAQRTYASGRSAAGSGEWTPKRQIVDALDAAFYAAFKTIVPAGKRTLLALDVSGSMSFNPISGLPITPREASAALALVTMASEPDTTCVGFTSGGGYGMRSAALTELALSPRQRLDDAIRSVSNLPFGGSSSTPSTSTPTTKPGPGRSTHTRPYAPTGRRRASTPASSLSG
jgi:60 kDa SS-A/Ro ribonucleoprotein